MAKKRRVEKPKEYTRRQLSHFQKQKRRQRIVFISGMAIIAAIIVITLAGWYIGEYRPLHKTVIKVKDTEFNTSYFIELLKIYGASQPGQSLEAFVNGAQEGVVENELKKQAAQGYGITVNDEEIKAELKENGAPVNRVYVDLSRGQKLETKLKDDYFGPEIPASDNQVHMMTMLTESEAVAQELRSKLIMGDNFTALAGEYAQNYYSKNVNKGDFGWHPQTVLEAQLGSLIPIDYAFMAQAGDISPPLSDNVSYKQLGYWVIKVLSMSEDEEAEVQALYLGSRHQALEIKARLESGDNLSALAKQYSQYSTSKENGGELGTVAKPASANDTSISTAFDTYVFDPATELGNWSEPVRDTALWTQGGAWIVQLVEKQDNRELSAGDRSFIINQVYSEWLSQLKIMQAAEVDTSGLTEEVVTWMVERATRELQQAARG
ncbi:MAG: hypothetical protein A2Y92_00120 [Chloroflexi bacterium RBG_13_57_8]|nr:MAG: hypothetical protein A2Y92_00120 [Chloroflexi bacterium RBG_13_57_8]